LILFDIFSERFCAHLARIAAAIRARPSAVRGPVLIPPWSLQRPFSIAFAWHGAPSYIFGEHHRTFFFSSKTS
jgi:hypothetical protein